MTFSSFLSKGIVALALMGSLFLGSGVGFAADLKPVQTAIANKVKADQAFQIAQAATLAKQKELGIDSTTSDEAQVAAIPIYQAQAQAKQAADTAKQAVDAAQKAYINQIAQSTETVQAAAQALQSMKDGLEAAKKADATEAIVTYQKEVDKAQAAYDSAKKPIESSANTEFSTIEQGYQLKIQAAAIDPSTAKTPQERDQKVAQKALLEVQGECSIQGSACSKDKDAQKAIQSAKENLAQASAVFMSTQQASLAKTTLNLCKLGMCIGTMYTSGKDPIEYTAAKIIRFATRVIAPLAILGIIYGGLQMIISVGSEDKVKKGRAMILYAVLSLVGVFSAWVIVTLALQVLYSLGA